MENKDLNYWLSTLNKQDKTKSSPKDVLKRFTRTTQFLGIKSDSMDLYDWMRVKKMERAVCLTVFALAADRSRNATLRSAVNTCGYDWTRLEKLLMKSVVAIPYAVPSSPYAQFLTQNEGTGTFDISEGFVNFYPFDVSPLGREKLEEMLLISYKRGRAPTQTELYGGISYSNEKYKHTKFEAITELRSFFENCHLKGEEVKKEKVKDNGIISEYLVVDKEERQNPRHSFEEWAGQDLADDRCLVLEQKLFAMRLGFNVAFMTKEEWKQSCQLERAYAVAMEIFAMNPKMNRAQHQAVLRSSWINMEKTLRSITLAVPRSGKETETSREFSSWLLDYIEKGCRMQGERITIRPWAVTAKGRMMITWAHQAFPVSGCAPNRKQLEFGCHLLTRYDGKRGTLSKEEVEYWEPDPEAPDDKKEKDGMDRRVI